MVYDCFCFFNELDLLEIRLNVLKDVVDRFVLVEAPWTHSGNRKPLYFNENRERYAAFADKIIHIVASEPPPAPIALTARQRAWLRENFQRNEAIRGLTNAQPEDTIIISDLDEIPDPTAIRKARKLHGVTRLGLRMYNYFLNYRVYSMVNWLQGSQVCSVATYRLLGSKTDFLAPDCLIDCVNEGMTLSRLRLLRPDRILRNAGWHFSFCGGIEIIRTKLKAFAHTEYATDEAISTENIEKALREGRGLFAHQRETFAERIGKTYPRYLIANQSRYAALIFPIDADYLQSTRSTRFKVSAFANLVDFARRITPRRLYPLGQKVYDWCLRLHR